MRLHINIDHVATLRNQREVSYPAPIDAARLCMKAGADGITVHLREDRRHIRDADVELLSQARLGLLNLEMAATEEMSDFSRRLRPDVITLVPEKREEKTTEGGLDVVSGFENIRPIALMCREVGIKLSLFIEADAAQVRASAELGAQQVEFHTGHYCDAAPDDRPSLLKKIEEGARLAAALRMEVAAGHGLTCDNVGPIAGIPEVEELNIGHSIVSEAVLVGMEQAVLHMRRAIDQARHRAE